MGDRATVTGPLHALAASCGLLLLCGCQETIEGQYIATGSIQLHGDVTSHGDGEAEMVLRFVAGANRPVDLVGDQVQASADGEGDSELPAESVGHYTTHFAIDSSDTEFSVALVRPDSRKRDAPHTIGTLPQDFELSSNSPTNQSRGLPMEIRWEPSGDAELVRILLSGPCIEDTEVLRLDDDGEHTLAAGALSPDGRDPHGSCEAELEVIRSVRGEEDEHLSHESRFLLHQARSLPFTSVP